jgi:hypothetical protein
VEKSEGRGTYKRRYTVERSDRRGIGGEMEEQRQMGKDRVKESEEKRDDTEKKRQKGRNRRPKIENSDRRAKIEW